MSIPTADQERFMAAALAESRRALPDCRPNPPVGCVIVGEGVILARGFTGCPGDPHAEAAAIAALTYSGDPRLLTAFVTLEPCSFHGRTPSCARALVASGIGTVIVGIIDPDPRNNGGGIRLLRDAGISVEVGVLGDAVQAFLDPYLLRETSPSER
jgi:pyrimidine deaminase RibD-like protein